MTPIIHDINAWDHASHTEQDDAINAVQDKHTDTLKHIRTSSYQCCTATHRIATFQHVPTGILLNLIPGGSYMMGSDHSDALKYEQPVHPVTIRQPFLIGVHPVTQQQWDTIGGEDNRCFDGDDLPIETITWDSAYEWTNKAGLRLPSESEWEYACRAGTDTLYPWGDTFNHSYAWIDDNSHGRTRPVTVHDKYPNAFGLVDMIGNVHEYCMDTWTSQYHEGPYDEQPVRFHRNGYVVRGGSFRDLPCDTYSARRLQCSHTYASYTTGFRAAMSV